MSYKIYAGTQNGVDSWENRVCMRPALRWRLQS